MTRPETIIPEKPTSPYPIHTTAPIISGFGRGSSELGIPTANIPINAQLNSLPTGIYYGWCKIHPVSDQNDETRTRPDGQLILFNHGNKLQANELVVHPMVMSIGWNPFYQNKEKAAEIHIMSKFERDFYGAELEFIVLGYVRPELDYTTKEALIEDILTDIRISRDILENKEEYTKYKKELE
ncbi:riboflavin kinase [Lodderomyces elongisporus NRRL YB-4239]|uniref:Riboflavin kinase n=1 Tax=Lodderomyces elongisporus (strain ATCC 11503 / CBS 2605 / JCM 1781 / NBRC 1676 / NRRL YB-4239) TaxID=379508 RepID=RIFK_LODEL|nr:RecName: Full=Riboflavin kinase; AltName: Full=Flavin mononucleotide kinase 1 [Lodderomyces elongisporus NRRL YB-4239]EDK45208.1 riboflavin kinase [Lodderomyces elongisporus NRRL YB-4239]